MDRSHSCIWLAKAASAAPLGKSIGALLGASAAWAKGNPFTWSSLSLIVAFDRGRGWLLVLDEVRLKSDRDICGVRNIVRGARLHVRYVWDTRTGEHAAGDLAQ